uniref:F-actin-capping protein subunit alpha n=1 Tax=Falco tinnunculus TaxID=100819 RepID=A0A8C4UGE9_FALTI
MCTRQELCEPEKVSFICSLLYQSLPGESGQAVPHLSAQGLDDKLVRHSVLLTHCNSLGRNCFFDRQDKFSFEFDRLCGVTSKPQLLPVCCQLRRKCGERPSTTAVCSIKSWKRQLFVACFAAHQYPPSNQWNNLWKSDWTSVLTPFSTHVTGIFLLQIHYLRDARLHVAVSKAVSETLNVIDQSLFATDFVKFVKIKDTKFHIAILKNIQALSEEIWGKNLPRKLPVACTFMKWNKILNEQYRGCCQYLKLK